MMVGLLARTGEWEEAVRWCDRSWTTRRPRVTKKRSRSSVRSSDGLPTSKGIGSRRSTTSPPRSGWAPATPGGWDVGAGGGRPRASRCVTDACHPGPGGVRTERLAGRGALRALRLGGARTLAGEHVRSARPPRASMAAPSGRRCGRACDVPVRVGLPRRAARARRGGGSGRSGVLAGGARRSAGPAVGDGGRGTHPGGARCRPSRLRRGVRGDGPGAPAPSTVLDAARARPNADDPGSIRRRDKQKRPAREPLQEAIAIFERLPAPSWIESAQAELSRIGGRRAAGDVLTAVERRVAKLAVAGRTNGRSPTRCS